MEAEGTIFKVFGMARPGFEPTTHGHEADALATRSHNHFFDFNTSYLMYLP